MNPGTTLKSPEKSGKVEKTSDALHKEALTQKSEEASRSLNRKEALLTEGGEYLNNLLSLNQVFE